MNNIEKNLFEFYSSFFYQSNIDELLSYLYDKLNNIILFNHQIILETEV